LVGTAALYGLDISKWDKRSFILYTRSQRSCHPRNLLYSRYGGSFPGG